MISIIDLRQAQLPGRRDDTVGAVLSAVGRRQKSGAAGPARVDQQRFAFRGDEQGAAAAFHIN